MTFSQGLYIEERLYILKALKKMGHASIFRKIHQDSNSAASDYHKLW